MKRTPTGATLHRARDANKDQTYYLSQVQEQQLAKVRWAELIATDIRLSSLSRAFRSRESATFQSTLVFRPLSGKRAWGCASLVNEASLGTLSVSYQVSSFNSLAAQYTSPSTSTGYFVNMEGKCLGPHRGLHYYTIGQRPGLGGMPGRWFVARKGVGSGEDILIVQGG